LPLRPDVDTSGGDWVARKRNVAVVPVASKEVSVANHQPSPAQGAERDVPAWAHLGEDFVMLDEIKPPPRIALARERMLMSRLYLGLIRGISDDYGAEFAAHSDSASLRAIGIYVFLRTLMCSPAHPTAIAHAVKLPRTMVLRRLQELVKLGYVERVGNAYRVTDKVNIPNLEEKLRRRIAMITETAARLAELKTSHDAGSE
jgi:DNA-binding HxlR family transcriptional regulator